MISNYKLNPLQFFTIFLYLFVFILLTIGHYWPLELFVNFRLQIGVITLLSSLFPMIYREWKEGLLIILAGLILIFPLEYVRSNSIEKKRNGSTDLKVTFANVAHRKNSVMNLLKMEETKSSDIILMAEAPKIIRNSTFAFMEKFSYQNFKTTGWASGIAVLSKSKILEFDYENRFIAGRIPWIFGRVKKGRRDISFWVMHPPNPLTPSKFQARNTMLNSINTILQKDHNIPNFVIGDLNVTPYSSYYPIIQSKKAKWKSSDNGTPFRFTWPSGYPSLYLNLDHFFYRSPISVQSYEILSDIDSDHFPIQVNLSVN